MCALRRHADTPNKTTSCPRRLAHVCVTKDVRTQLVALRDLVNLARLHVVDEPCYRRAFRDERRGADELDIVTDALLEVTEGQEIDIGGVLPEILPADAIEGGIVEGQHAAIGVVHDQHFLSPQQALGDDE